MGGRAAAYVLGDPDVAGACLLAAWIEPRDEVPAVAGRLVVIAHGEKDRTTDPAGSTRFAAAAAAAGATVAQFVVAGEGHAMLRRADAWHALARDACCLAFAVAPPRRPGQLVRVLAAPPAQRFGVPLAARSARLMIHID
jgi:dienelactone hydrolase